MALQQTASGLQYEDTVTGTGATAVAGKQVTVHYTGWLYQNGQQGANLIAAKTATTAFAFALGEAWSFAAGTKACKACKWVASAP